LVCLLRCAIASSGKCPYGKHLRHAREAPARRASSASQA
jgi:hypothetical protein